MRIKVVYSQWGADGFDVPLGGGEHVLDSVTETQARSIAAAEAAKVVEVLDATAAERALLDPHVQSQEDGEAAWHAAQDVHDELGNVVKQGGWQHGNLLSFVADRNDKLAADDARRGQGVKAGLLTAAERAEFERQIGEAEERLAGMEVPS